MAFDSYISGYIVGRGGRFSEETSKINQQALKDFPFDEKFPFRNMFWCDSSIYPNPIIGFTGSYKHYIEENWSEWLWKFSQFLSTLEARDAYVNLDCVRGNFRWRLQPQLGRYAVELQSPDTPEWPESIRGQIWGIVEAPEDDFTLNPRRDDNRGTFINPDTGKFEEIVWDKFVERWT